MNDLVDKLRKQAWQRSGAPKMDAGHTKLLEWKAADEIERLHAAIGAVVETFEKDEAQGFRSKDRQFAISILRQALPALPRNP